MLRDCLFVNPRGSAIGQHWDSHIEAGNAGLAIKIDIAIVIMDYRLADGQTHSCAFSRRFGREEWVEHLVLKLWRNAGPVVLEGHLGKASLVALVFNFSGDAKRPPVRHHRVKGIDREVYKHLLELFRIAFD